jgi:hypothetical protein
MANNIGFGTVNSYWGIGATSNSISWGSIYLENANDLLRAYRIRVEAAGGTVESLECIKIIK